MKVLIVNDTAAVIGGAASVAIQTADLLAGAGNEVVFFAAKGPIDDRLKNNPRIEVVLLNQELCLEDKNKINGAFRGLFNVSAYRQLRALLHKDHTIQVTHVHSWTKALSSSIFLALKKAKISTALTVHDYFLSCPNGGFYDYRRCNICPLRPMSWKCIARNCDRRNYLQKVYRVVRTGIQSRILRDWMPRLIHVSDFARRVLMRQSTRYDGVVIPNPIVEVNPEYVNCVANKKFAYVGRVDKEKGVDLFCEAATQIGAEAKVIGSGDELEDLKRRYPKIEFLGWQQQKSIPRLLNDVRCCVFPSLWYETAGLTLVEIMRECGIPFIVSSRTASRDLIENNVTGWLFETGNVQSLESEMEKVLDDSVLDGVVSALRAREQKNKVQTCDKYVSQLQNEYERMVESDHESRR